MSECVIAKTLTNHYNFFWTKISLQNFKMTSVALNEFASTFFFKVESAFYNL